MPLKSLEDIYSCVCPKCGANKYPEAAADPDKLSSLFESDIKRMAAQLYSQKTKAGKVDVKLANKVATVLSQAIMKGFGQAMPTLDFNSPDSEMYRNLQKQVYQFSFAKNYEQMKAATLALSQGDKVVPFDEFKGIVSRINQEYNVRFLKVEYDTAIGSSQMASRWVQYIADEVEMLVYQTVGDARVRPSHQELDGIVKKITDLFWKSYYPPNGWGCRCEALEATDEQETPDDQIITPTDVPPIFKRNLAADGMVYPPDHVYFEHAPDEVMAAANNNNPFLYERVFSDKRSKGSVWSSALHNPDEFKQNLDAAKVIAKKGQQVILLPEIKADNEAQRALRKMALNENTKPGKNPDCTIDGKIFDIKVLNSKSKSAVHHALGDGSKQADNLVIQLPKGLGEKNFKRYAKGRLKQMKTRPDEIWIINNGKLKKFTATELL